MAKILLVEDEPDLSDTIVDWLSDEYHLVEVEENGTAALSRLQSADYDLAILDVMLPGTNGVEICRAVRKSGSVLPIIMLTARNTVDAKEDGLDAGADDYLTKPFQLRELSARIRALLRRPSGRVLPNVLKVRDIELDRTKCAVSKSGKEVHLLPKEFALLELFMRHTGEVLSTDLLMDKVWGTECSIVTDTIRTNIKTLRKKLGDDGTLIRTVHGVGYRMDASE